MDGNLRGRAVCPAPEMALSPSSLPSPTLTGPAQESSRQGHAALKVLV